MNTDFTFSQKCPRTAYKLTPLSEDGTEKRQKINLCLIYTNQMRFLQNDYIISTYRKIRRFQREMRENACPVVMHRLIHIFHSSRRGITFLKLWKTPIPRTANLL